MWYTINIRFVIFIREGYVFGGWDVLVNGSYEKYEVTERNNDKVAFLSHE